MTNKFILTSVLSAFALTGIASAQTAGSGSIGVTANITGSIQLTFSTDTSGLAITGTLAALNQTLPFGTVAMFGGSVPSHVTQTNTGVASFLLSTPFDIRVDLANSASTSFSLVATLSTVDGNTWKLGTNDISAGTPVTLTSVGDYATVVPYTLNLSIPASAAPGSLTNSMSFTATAN